MSGMRGHSAHEKTIQTQAAAAKIDKIHCNTSLKLTASYWLPLKSAQNNNGDTREAAC